MLEESSDVCSVLDSCVEERPLEENILHYMSGFIVRTLQGTVSCQSCSDALVDDACLVSDHHYSRGFSHTYQMLTSVKNRGGLVLPSEAIFRILQRCESIFRQTVLSKPSDYLNRKSLVQFLAASFRYSVSEDRPTTLFTHTCEVECGLLSHSDQLANRIIDKYFRIRMKHFSKLYNRRVIGKMEEVIEAVCRG